MEPARSRSTSEATTAAAAASVALYGTQHHRLEDGATLIRTADPKDQLLPGVTGRASSAHVEDECPSLWAMEPILTSVFGQVTGPREAGRGQRGQMARGLKMEGSVKLRFPSKSWAFVASQEDLTFSSCRKKQKPLILCPPPISNI